MNLSFSKIFVKGEVINLSELESLFDSERLIISPFIKISNITKILANFTQLGEN